MNEVRFKRLFLTCLVPVTAAEAPGAALVIIALLWNGGDCTHPGDTGATDCQGHTHNKETYDHHFV